MISSTCHYIFFALKQAVLPKSRHSGNKAQIIGPSSRSPNKHVLSREINGDLVAGIGSAWFVVRGSRRRYDKHLSENSSIRLTSMSM